MGRRKRHGDEVNPEIKRLYVELRYSLNKISRELKIHPEVIKRKLLSMGVAVRNQSQARINLFRKDANV